MVLPSFQHSASVVNKTHTVSVTSRGFTLVELLVVITIISILAAVVMSSLNSARIRGRDGQRIGDIKRIEIALGQYYDKYDRYPATIGPATASVLVTEGFLDSLPLDPRNNSVYSYAAFVSGIAAGTALCSSYHLGADLESSTNSELIKDSDTYVGATALSGERLVPNMSLCSGSAADFHGTDAAGSKCNAANVGTTCYDVRP